MAEIGDGLILYALVAHGNKVLAEYTNPSSSSLNVSKIGIKKKHCFNNLFSISIIT